ncbi:MAG TPA: putative oxidoreductase C-terminal domain-containing protein, partial [bacterium]|nr:putative oxidoreductase C-terminal domain-containing protein [bacterium]
MDFTGAENEVKLITLDPGHFHAALVQKSMYQQVDPVVHVYAPEGEDVRLHLRRIEQYNNRETDPTSWQEEVYMGPDYLDRMLREKPGNVVVLAGNNKLKAKYIFSSIDAGLNVLADKPMCIDPAGFDSLKQSFSLAEERGVLLYDIMTERYEITTILQRELSMIESVFGSLQEGTPDNPAVTKESVHHFFKYVSGSPLQRPPWYYDVNQQGEGVVDVTTHLVDLIQWECFPGEIINYQNDIEMLSADHWATEITPD